MKIEIEDEDWWITIVRSKDIYYIESPFYDIDTGETTIEREIIQCKEEGSIEEAEREAFTRVMQLLAEYFGFFYDKYSKHNLTIGWDEKGNHLDNGEERDD